MLHRSYVSYRSPFSNVEEDITSIDKNHCSLMIHFWRLKCFGQKTMGHQVLGRLQKDKINLKWFDFRHDPCCNTMNESMRGKKQRKLLAHNQVEEKSRFFFLPVDSDPTAPSEEVVCYHPPHTFFPSGKTKEPFQNTTYALCINLLTVPSSTRKPTLTRLATCACTVVWMKVESSPLQKRPRLKRSGRSDG